MNCIFLSTSEEYCKAAIYNTDWKVDKDTLSKHCKTKEFDRCPRYCAFIEYEKAKSTLKFESKK